MKLIAGLDKTIFEPVVVLHTANGPLAKYFDDLSLPYVVAPPTSVLSPIHRKPLFTVIGKGLRYLGDIRAMVRFLKHLEAEIVHTNDGQMHVTWAPPARLAGAKLLWHHRGDPTAKGVNWLAPLLANHIVTVSNFAKPARPVCSVAGRLTVLHSPFDHPDVLPDRDTCRQALVRELGLRDDARFVGYFGALIERKRPLDFVASIAAFNQRHPDVPLHGLLFGIPEKGGPPLDREVGRTAAGLGVADRIHLMGFRSPVAPYMRAVDALLVPALNEPFGRTLIEAMLLGTPVIATDHGGNREAIADRRNGFLVPAMRPECFVDPLSRILTDRTEWQRISEEAERQARSKYGVAEHIAGITRIYREMAGPAIPSS
ncbi:glycosyltransferase family 4 protein [Rhizobium sp. TRM95111]|uniref:glycosyltransferase family 4 protein n=1 Tax=Rhizobium alarense TaxID=2846851 RepID=UPI001F44B5B7|nr:glycosyltransferase family 4 protein [Rhizobium alarense]MCF3641807.1 glycosyltransferase family 4 protein [Rhizobium alarense]